MNGQVNVIKQNVASYDDIRKNSSEYEMFLLKELDGIIEPGNKVVIKPNFVKESHMRRYNDWDYVITHPEIIRLVLSYVVKLLNNQGEVYVVDAPQTDSDYDKIVENIGLCQLVADIQKTTDVEIKYYDLREERWFYKDGIIVSKKKLQGDPKGYSKINLRDTSEFFGKENMEYYGADYDMDETKKYHNETDNIYVMANTILDADVFINLPKMKTHKLGGITCCLKNLVGTCVIKNSIPHHTLGSPENGGDKYKNRSAKGEAESKFKNAALKILKMKNPIINYPFILIKRIAGVVFGSPKTETIRNGMWYGNDTIWRSCLDLNKILLYADKNGVMHDSIQRRYFAVVDGIFAGEGNGPMEPDKVEAGVLLSGTNPVAIDVAVATIMGFDYSKIPTIFRSFNANTYKLVPFPDDSIEIKSNFNEWNRKVSSIEASSTLQFRPHFGWKNYIERK